MANTGSLTRCLNNFYKERASPHYLTQQFVCKLKEAAEFVIKITQEKDPRFGGELLDVGSMESQVCAVNIEECDILILLNIAGHWIQDMQHPNYARFKLDRKSKKIWQDCSTEDGYLLPRKLADLFHSYVTDIISSDKLLTKYPVTNGKRIEVSGEGSVATTLTASPDVFRMLGTFFYSVDMVPAVKCSGWPTAADAAWLQEQAPWPEQVKSHGFQLVAKSFFGGKAGTETLWRLSFATSEKFILDNLGYVKPCFKDLLVIHKAIRKYKLSSSLPTVGTPIISSYHMKTVLFHETLKYPNDEDWKDEKLGERFLSAFRYLGDCVDKGVLTHFMVPSVNLFAGRGSLGFCQKVIKAVLDDPEAYIQNLVKETWKSDSGSGLKTTF